MGSAENTTWNGIERRKLNGCRRNAERRAYKERRRDTRNNDQGHIQGFYAWLRALTKPRLGVDRRKNVDRRVNPGRRDKVPKSILTKEELADLLR